MGSASNYRIINIFIYKDLVFTHVHEFFYKKNYIASMTRFLEIFRKLFELRLANYTFFSKINILNYVVLLCIEFVILLIEEKMMSYVTVSEGHRYPLVFYIILRSGRGVVYKSIIIGFSGYQILHCCDFFL